MIKKTLLAATLLAATGAAQAELVEYDWETQGDGAVTLDTKTGNIWLDLKMTADMSINEVKSLVQNDVRFAGWRMPTVNEVRELAGNIFNIDPTIRDTASIKISEESKTEHALMGAPIGNYVYGIYENEGGTNLFGSSVNGLFLNYVWDSRSLGWSRNYEGVYLVSTDYNTSYDAVSINERMGASDVSAPMALGAFGILLALAGMRLRKSS
jgi:hypothetical protein